MTSLQIRGAGQTNSYRSVDQEASGRVSCVTRSSPIREALKLTSRPTLSTKGVGAHPTTPSTGISGRQIYPLRPRSAQGFPPHSPRWTPLVVTHLPPCGVRAETEEGRIPAQIRCRNWLLQWKLLYPFRTRHPDHHCLITLHQLSSLKPMSLLLLFLKTAHHPDCSTDYSSITETF